ncbi:hypothetical protein BHE74_00009974 [Ensete ventricosum]|nr:hypothetical protein BHE74_00009974 [Ensete ventricosum]
MTRFNNNDQGNVTRAASSRNVSRWVSVASLEPYILHGVCSCARHLLLGPLLSDPPFSSSSDLIVMDFWGLEIKPEEAVKDSPGEEQICASFSGVKWAHIR